MQGNDLDGAPPPPKRPKIRLACRECRDRKVRCDGGRPTCGGCSRKGLGPDSCVYTDTSDHPPEYVKSLENRIKDLERVITNALTPNAGTEVQTRESGSLPRATPLQPSRMFRRPATSNTDDLSMAVEGQSSSSGAIHSPASLLRTTSAVKTHQTRTFPGQDQPDAPTSRDLSDRIRPERRGHIFTSLHRPSGMNSDDMEGGIMAMGTEGLTASGSDNPDDPASVYLGRSSAAAFLQEIRSNPRKRRQGLNESPAGDRDGYFADTPSSRQSRGTNRPSENAILALMQELELPPRRVANTHLENYWQNFYPFNPILHRPTFQKRYEEIWAENVPTIESPLPQNAENQDVDSIRAFYVLFNIILALGCLWPSPQGTSDSVQRAQADVFYKRSEALVSAAALAHGNLLSVQAFILMAQYLQITGKANQCWLMVGTAIRIAQGIGIHLDPAVESQAQQQERRRTWWYCIQMDRILSMMFGRPPMVIWPSSIPMPELTDDDLLSTQPYSASNPIPQVEMSIQGFFVYSMRYTEIILNVLSTFYMQPQNPRPELGTNFFHQNNCSKLLDLEASLNEWRNQLPDYLYTRPDAVSGAHDIRHRQSVALYCRYLHLKMLMFRPSTVEAAKNSAFVSPDSELTGLQRSMAVGCVHSCVGAAEEIIRVLHSRCTSPDVQLPNWWYPVFYVFTASTVILAVMLSPHAGSLCPDSSESLAISWEQALEVLEIFEAQGATFARRCSVILRTALAQGQTTPGTLPITSGALRLLLLMNLDDTDSREQHVADGRDLNEAPSQHGEQADFDVDGDLTELLMGESWWNSAGIDWLENL